MKIQPNKLVRPVWANKEQMCVCIQNMQVLPKALCGLPEKHEPAALSAPALQHLPFPRSFPCLKALGQGGGWRAEAGPASLSTSCLFAPTSALREPPIPAGPDQALSSSQRASPARASASAPRVNTHPTNRLQGELQPLMNLGRCRQHSLKKKNG